MSDTEATDRALDESYKEECDRLRLLLGVNGAVNSYLDLQELLAAVEACLTRVIRYEYTSLTLHDPLSNAEHVPAFDRSDNRATFVNKDRTQSAATILNTPVGRALATKMPVTTNSAAEHLAYKNPVLDEFVAQGFRSSANIPLLVDGEAIGSLNVASRRENGFGGSDVEFLVQVASQITPAVRNAFAFREIQSLKDKIMREKVYLETELQGEFQDIVGESPELKKVLTDVETVAPTDSTVLIWGETGTGKELIARAIHNLSGRRGSTFVKLNCAAIPTGLLESELFGHEKGAFTGALSQRIGRFELADGGTLFLDEVGDIPAELQPKLLRVLQEREFERLGSNKTIRVNVRLLAATNRDLLQMVSGPHFSQRLLLPSERVSGDATAPSRTGR